MSRFVTPDTKLLTLSTPEGKTEPDWLLVRMRLNEGERRAMFARMYLGGVDGALRVNPQAVGLATVLAYLLDWSFTDDQGKRVVIADQPIETIQSALDALDPDDFNEVRIAIEKHEKTVDKARADAKKKTDGASKSKAISGSPNDSAGDTSGSPSSIAMST